MTDEETKHRFTNLAIVGDYLYQISNENGEQTDYFLAKTALQSFAEAIELVEIDEKTRSGVNNLVKYLDKKIEKRNRQASGEFSQD